MSMRGKDTSTGVDSHHVSRLYWQCRRGMLELDLLLKNFMDHKYQGLNATECQAFEVLLQSPDQLLFDYLLGDTVPFDKEVAHVVQQIKNPVIQAID